LTSSVTLFSIYSDFNRKLTRKKDDDDDDGKFFSNINFSITLVDADVVVVAFVVEKHSYKNTRFFLKALN
jgi:hypothetical protein